MNHKFTRRLYGREYAFDSFFSLYIVSRGDWCFFKNSLARIVCNLLQSICASLFFVELRKKAHTARARMHNENDIQFLIDFGLVMMLDAFFPYDFDWQRLFVVDRALSFAPLAIACVVCARYDGCFFTSMPNGFFSFVRSNYSCITKDHKINFDHRE